MMRGERLTAFELLLAKPDEQPLRRGHHLTCPGDPRRLEERWLRVSRIWIAHRLGQRGVIEGWTLARRVAASPIMIGPIERGQEVAWGADQVGHTEGQMALAR
jgi:hypothetical protein